MDKTYPSKWFLIHGFLKIIVKKLFYHVDFRALINTSFNGLNATYSSRGISSKRGII